MNRAASSRRAILLGVGTAIVLGLVAVPTNALAYPEPNPLGGNGCLDCHVLVPTLGDPPGGGVCVDCHGGPAEPASTQAIGFNPAETSGPHGSYLTTTRKCATCHTVHDAPDEGVLLLPAASVHGTCFTCHDGTGGWGVYRVLEWRGVAPQGPEGRYPGHRYEAANVIPGGDSDTGGPAPGAFSGAGGHAHVLGLPLSARIGHGCGIHRRAAPHPGNQGRHLCGLLILAAAPPSAHRGHRVCG